MNFQRGLAPTEAMGVGQIAIAPVIKALYTLDPSNMVSGKNGKAFPARLPATFVGAETLEKVRDGKLNPRFVAFSTMDEIDEFGEFVVHRLSEYKGLFVKFEDITYKIPK